MYNVLQDFRDPVCREGNEDQKTDDLCARATTDSSATGWVLTRFVFDVNRYQCDREPCSKGCCDQASEEGYEVDVAVSFRDINAGLQHEDGEGNTWDPGDEADAGGN